MLKSHQQENCGELYPIATDIFEHFLSESGFTCTNITNGFDIHKKGELYIKIPQKKNLTKKQVKNLLTKAGLQIEDFNLYIEHTKATNLFNFLVDESLKGPSLKNKNTES